MTARVRELKKRRVNKAAAQAAGTAQRLITSFMQIRPVTPAAYHRIRENSYLGSISRRLRRRRRRWTQRTLRDCGVDSSERPCDEVATEILDSIREFDEQQASREHIREAAAGAEAERRALIWQQKQAMYRKQSAQRQSPREFTRYSNDPVQIATPNITQTIAQEETQYAVFDRG